MNIEKVIKSLNENYVKIEGALKATQEELKKYSPEAWEIKKQEELKKVNEFLAIINSPETWEAKRQEEVIRISDLVDYWVVMLEMLEKQIMAINEAANAPKEPTANEKAPEKEEVAVPATETVAS